MIADPTQPDPAPDEQIEPSLLGGEHVKRGRMLFHTGIVLLIAALTYFAYNAKVSDVLHLYLGLMMFTLSFLPGLLWAKNGGSRFPVFETILILCANTYALPVLNANDQLPGYSSEVITHACLTVILYQLSAIVSYTSVRGTYGQTKFWHESLITDKVEKLMGYGLLLSALYVWLSTFTTLIPNELNSSLRAIFFGIGILSTFVCAQRWGRGELTSRGKALMLCALIPQLIFMSVGLLLIGVISLVGIGLLGYLSGGKRIPWLSLTITFVVLAVLHTGKTRMREKYWEQEYPAPTMSQLPAYFSEWIQFGLEPTSGDKTVSQKMLERTSLMHILCLVIDYTPSRQAFLHGKTYGYVLPQLIPRLVWPDKPRSHVATYELSIYYGLQNEEDTEKTTIAFGLLTEAYANFGVIGATLLGLFWGVGLKKLQIWSTYSPMFSFAGLLMILMTAWALNSEFTMAAWVSSLYQALVVLLGIPLILRKLLGL